MLVGVLLVALVTMSSPGPAWVPAVSDTWQIQLSGKIDTRVEADIFDVDLDTSSETLKALEAKGVKTVCYFSAGSFEPWRKDKADYPPNLLGKPLDGWPDERWLDIREIEVLRGIIGKRMDECKAKGFDGVDPDNMDGYAQNSGFPLSEEDQLQFNLMVANEAHERGLAVGLKNSLDQARQLAPYYDFAVNEQCQQYEECDLLGPFRGKAVLQIEYVGAKPTCKGAPGAYLLIKRLNLGAWRKTCPTG